MIYINEIDYKKLLSYLDKYFTKEKVEIDSNGMMGSHYDGLIFEDYFSDCIISAEYLDIYDYLQSKYGIDYYDDKSLLEQYSEIQQEKRYEIIEAFYNILYLSHYNYVGVNVQNILNKVNNFLNRLNFRVLEQKHIGVTIQQNNKLGSGYYSEVYKVNNRVVKKKLKKEHLSNESICERLKYEYEMMLKLKDCSKIVKVFDYDDVEKSYTMEECDECLYDFLTSQVDIELSKKVKIINDILEAMKYAHENSVIHRDLHLGNIMRNREDFLVVDFGLGKNKEIIKSLITSATPKNSHWFVDPIGLQDFTQLDESSDIYSIGKIIDYIMCNGTISTNHIFSFVVLKCTNRDKNNRYVNVSEIQKDIRKYLSGEEQLIKQEEINRKIENGVFDLEVQEYLIKLVNSNKLCNYIVNKKCQKIYKIILKLDIDARLQIANELLENYALATGYNGWSNYSLFGILAYNIYINEQDNTIKNIYKQILNDCASIRYDIKNLYDQLV